MWPSYRIRTIQTFFFLHNGVSLHMCSVLRSLEYKGHTVHVQGSVRTVRTGRCNQPECWQDRWHTCVVILCSVGIRFRSVHAGCGWNALYWCTIAFNVVSFLVAATITSYFSYYRSYHSEEARRSLLMPCFYSE